jgi:hypothetical protein
VKGDGHAEITYNSALAKAGTDMVAYSRQRDAYLLSKMGNRDMKRLWGDFAAECPAIARLIVKEVETDRAESAKVAEQVDARLREAERLLVKTRKPKVTKSARKAAARSADGLADFLAVLLDSADPATRESARAALDSRV